jgi:hypothetical protein
MVDHEVAEILAEIKRRVTTAQQQPVAEPARSMENPAALSTRSAVASNGYPSLSVMARAWDRLPPVVSNRTGTMAKLELWIKAKFRAAFRWFTWEQVNFNSAAYQTMLEVVDALKAYEQSLAEMRQGLDAEREEFRRELDQLSATLAPLTTQIDQVDHKHLALMAQLNARLEGLSQLAKDQQTETQARLSELLSESRVRDEQMSDEQRVCYKQLALELSESRVLEDRARRELEARLAKLETGK